MNNIEKANIAFLQSKSPSTDILKAAIADVLEVHQSLTIAQIAFVLHVTSFTDSVRRKIQRVMQDNSDFIKVSTDGNSHEWALKSSGFEDLGITDRAPHEIINKDIVKKVREVFKEKLLAPVMKYHDIFNAHETIAEREFKVLAEYLTDEVLAEHEILNRRYVRQAAMYVLKQDLRTSPEYKEIMGIIL